MPINGLYCLQGILVSVYQTHCAFIGNLELLSVFFHFLDFQEPDAVNFAFHAVIDVTCTFLREQYHKLNTPSRVLYIHIFKRVFGKNCDCHFPSSVKHGYVEAA